MAGGDKGTAGDDAGGWACLARGLLHFFQKPKQGRPKVCSIRNTEIESVRDKFLFLAMQRTLMYVNYVS